MSGVGTQSAVKARQLLHDIETYNKTTVDYISGQIDKIEAIDKEFVQIVKPLKNETLAAEANRRLDLKIWALDPLPTEKLAKHAQ
ncbi:uncharacterized protein MONOS_10099 [Monocercomonoides exilis]|uniref:uncharacterized protein n=1 Tax=Monocercomonoides exilis TaxID=2049356 RepID=UPI0035594C0E|nr:hypothetical protein MONOS_10099 [Monocercomonoides exilis]|eukprot:MONOS_10099.1-p1 / transcript=MONOS_10099.1 / gene=MONOS_10099 / organism=Monocercomonoides_exilis_PA203 / gene_product=unspecified product / transcript_product=unspecified product / location=Mono_scaffold00444:13860-14227(-) / protein_length=85 / sequence_SO=supercontig / SO=protein_coding / is_pseudo=false